MFNWPRWLVFARPGLHLTDFDRGLIPQPGQRHHFEDGNHDRCFELFSHIADTPVALWQTYCVQK